MSDSSTQTLPEPDQVSKQQSNQLKQRILAACQQVDGWINFSAYMNFALYEPRLGYYSSGLQKFGEKGDFITAPEVSPLFGQCLARQISEIIRSYRKSSDTAVHVLEFGAGSGILAVDILLQLEALECLPEKYLIIELSAALKQRQHETLTEKAGHLLNRVQWLDRLPDSANRTIVVANEVLDAMPVECFRIDENSGIESLMVGFDGERLISKFSAADSGVVNRIEGIKQRSELEFSSPYISEFNPSVHGWLAALDSCCESAVVLLIDYGYNEFEYYHADRTGGTMMCYYRHRAHEDYFWWPGLQDITAFVNFTDVAYSAAETGFDISGYTTQAAFLLACGISDLHAEQVTDEVQQQVKLSQQIKTLTLPSEMGDRFKVMALSKNYDESLSGFSMLDLRNRL